jgi:ribonuclease E
VALQLLRGIEEILMKGATHNLVVRTRTDVALYVLNHKRGHLRDLENAFKVTLAVVADPTVAGQQSFIIDRGEQVHTLEAAKALLVAQAAAFPVYVEEPYDEEEAFDVEVEVETEETEGLTEETAGGEEAVAGESEADGHRRKRRRRRRGRGEPREGGAPRDDNDVARVAPEAIEGAVVDDSEGEDDEGDEQPGVARGEQGPNGERRPRRRGRRGGRRRRGNGPEDGLAGSIADELGPTSVSEAASAVADFDGGSYEPAPTLVEPEPVSQQPQPQWQPAEHVAPATVSSAPSAEETAQEADPAAARRRSTVREKVSFMTSAPSDPAPAVSYSEAEPATAPAPAPAEPAPAASGEAAPRKAGWWSRRFGNGE